MTHDWIKKAEEWSHGRNTPGGMFDREFQDGFIAGSREAEIVMQAEIAAKDTRIERLEAALREIVSKDSIYTEGCECDDVAEKALEEKES